MPGTVFPGKTPFPDHRNQNVQLNFHHQRPKRPVDAFYRKRLQKGRRIGQTDALHNCPGQQIFPMPRNDAGKQSEHPNRQHNVDP